MESRCVTVQARLLIFPCMLVFASLLLAICTLASPPAVQRLRVEYLTEDQATAIETATPRFSWGMAHAERSYKQTAYQVNVVQAGQTVWSSGKVASNDSLNVKCGASLDADTTYNTTVTVWDSNGNPSDPASIVFTTSLLSSTVDPAWSGAQWVAGDPNNLLRAHFTLPKTSGPVTRARLFISGLGYYKAWINGDKADNHELGSFTTFEERVLYDIVDVTQQVHGEGAVNTIGVQLGHGWYAQPSVNVGPRQLLTMIKVTCQDGNTYVFASAAPGSSGRTAPWDAASASTSTTRSRLAVGTPVPAGREGTTGTPLPFESAPGPVTSDDIYLGEAYDARLLPDGWAGSPEPSTEVPSGEGYQPAVLSAGQVGAMAARQVQIYRDNSYSPRYISEPYDGVYVADMEQNMAGICTIRVQGQAGQTVHMQHAEIMNTDGTIHDVYRNAPMWANYTLKGSPGWEVYTPQFTYFGFRYVQITGMLVPPQPEDIVCHFIHSDTSRGSASAFESSSSMLNAIQQATRFASLSNQMDVFSDCPQRERRQWLGDMQLSCETVLHNFDVGAQYTKGIMDIADGQRHYEANFGGNGSIADCVPWYKHGRLPADPAWSVAFPLITRWVSRWFDDEDLVSEHYEGIKKYVDFEVNQAQGYKAKGGNGIDLPSTYGDWCPPGHGCPNKYEDLTSFYFIEGVDVVAQFAGVLGKDEDQAHYSQLAATLRQQYKSTYAIPNSAAANGGVQLYGKGDQFSQMLAVASGVVTGADADALVDWVIANITSDSARVPYHIEGGIVFVKLLWPLLSARGATDLALGLQTNQTGPSYGEMINQTATTLWESWDMDEFNGGASRNHIMYGGQGSWYYSNLAGIQRPEGASDWSTIRIKPDRSKTLGYVQARLDTPAGPVETHVQQGEQGVCAAGPEHANLTLQCLGPDGKTSPDRLFSGVAFASFGTPSGRCGSFVADSSCDANSSVSVVRELCVGKSECTVRAEDSVFGDPCFDVVKRLSIQLEGNCALTGTQVSASLPANTQGEVWLPLQGHGASAANVTATESQGTVWSKGQFQPGVPGVHSGRFDAESSSLVFQVGSGSYAFKDVST